MPEAFVLMVAPESGGQLSLCTAVIFAELCFLLQSVASSCRSPRQQFLSAAFLLLCSPLLLDATLPDFTSHLSLETMAQLYNHIPHMLLEKKKVLTRRFPLRAL